MSNPSRQFNYRYQLYRPRNGSRFQGPVSGSPNMFIYPFFGSPNIYGSPTLNQPPNIRTPSPVFFRSPNRVESPGLFGVQNIFDPLNPSGLSQGGPQNVTPVPNVGPSQDVQPAQIDYGIPGTSGTQKPNESRSKDEASEASSSSNSSQAGFHTMEGPRNADDARVMDVARSLEGTLDFRNVDPLNIAEGRNLDPARNLDVVLNYEAVRHFEAAHNVEAGRLLEGAQNVEARNVDVALGIGAAQNNDWIARPALMAICVCPMYITSPRTGVLIPNRCNCESRNAVRRVCMPCACTSLRIKHSFVCGARVYECSCGFGYISACQCRPGMMVMASPRHGANNENL